MDGNPGNRPASRSYAASFRLQHIILACARMKWCVDSLRYCETALFNEFETKDIAESRNPTLKKTSIGAETHEDARRSSDSMILQRLSFREVIAIYMPLTLLLLRVLRDPTLCAAVFKASFAQDDSDRLTYRGNLSHNCGISNPNDHDYLHLHMCRPNGSIPCDKALVRCLCLWKGSLSRRSSKRRFWRPERTIRKIFSLMHWFNVRG